MKKIRDSEEDSRVVSLLRLYLRQAPLSRALIRSRELDLILERRPSGRILDLGHGDGVFANCLEQNGLKIFVGLDASFDELMRARDRSSAHLVVGDMQRLPFRDGAFASAISNCVLEHVEHLETAVLEAQRVLIPGGAMLATVVTDKYESLLFWPQFLRSVGLRRAAAFYLDKIRSGFVHRRYLSVQEWIGLFRRVGFAIVDAKPYAGVRRQALMDIFLPFVAGSKILRQLIGREVLFANRWPADSIANYCGSDITEEMLGESANLMLVVARPDHYRS